MKIVVDMNLSPQWVGILTRAGHECVHWSQLGSADAPDREVMGWARSKGYVVLTHDLDFGAILATTAADSPSVLQVRAQDISPQRMGEMFVSAFEQFEEKLNQGALVSIDQERARARILPLTKQD